MDQAAWAWDQPWLSLSKPQFALLIVRQTFPPPFGFHAGWSGARKASSTRTQYLQPGRKILDLNAASELPSSPQESGSNGRFQSKVGRESAVTSLKMLLTVSGNGQAARVCVQSGCVGEHLLFLSCPCYCHQLPCVTLGLSCADCAHCGYRLQL